MSDEIDLAQQKEEIGLAYAIRRAMDATGRPILATGRCLWCDAITSDEQRWCGVPCRDSWQKQTGVK